MPSTSETVVLDRISAHTRRNFRLDIKSQRTYAYEFGGDMEAGEAHLTLHDGIVRAFKTAPAPELEDLIVKRSDQLKFKSGPLGKKRLDDNLLAWNIETLINAYNLEYPLRKLQDEAEIAASGAGAEQEEAGPQLALDDHISLAPANREKGQDLSALQIAYLLYELNGLDVPDADALDPEVVAKALAEYDENKGKFLARFHSPEDVNKAMDLLHVIQDV